VNATRLPKGKRRVVASFGHQLCQCEASCHAPLQVRLVYLGSRPNMSLYTVIPILLILFILLKKGG